MGGDECGGVGVLGVWMSRETHTHTHTHTQGLDVERTERDSAVAGLEEEVESLRRKLAQVPCMSVCLKPYRVECA